MKTINKVDIATEFVHFIPEKENMIFGVLYISKEYKTASHLCLCGCGNLVVTPLGDDGWKLVELSNNKITLSPSIGNFYFHCKSHYIIVKNVANFV